MVSRLALNVSIRLDNFLSMVYKSMHSDSHVLCIRPTRLRIYGLYQLH